MVCLSIPTCSEYGVRAHLLIVSYDTQMLESYPSPVDCVVECFLVEPPNPRTRQSVHLVEGLLFADTCILMKFNTQMCFLTSLHLTSNSSNS